MKCDKKAMGEYESLERFVTIVECVMDAHVGNLVDSKHNHVPVHAFAWS